MTGIHIAKNPSYSIASPISRIEMDLGNLSAAFLPWPDPYVDVIGKKLVCPNKENRWGAEVFGVYAPVEYAWSGVLTGNGPEVKGFVVTPGWLKLQVSDARDMTGQDSLYVRVRERGPPDNPFPDPDCDR